MKKYLDKNVYEAFKERINYIFDEFEHIYVSLSGGKDSSVTLQLIDIEAQKRHRKVDVMFIDYEAQYQMTIDHVNELKQLKSIGEFYHICLPFKAANSNSIFQPNWYPWNEKYKDIWVRNLPEDSINQYNHPFGDLYNENLFLRGLFKMFSTWYKDLHGTDKVANIIGLRSDESMNRFRAIAFGKSLYKDINWTTDNGNGIYSCYPIYDFRTEDVWVAVSKFDFKYNLAYDLMYKNGLSIHEQRIAQPYGFKQFRSLEQWSLIEPETWIKVVNRVSGANFGNMYGKTKLLGHNGTSKPEHFSWEQYTVFLLESLGLYSPELRDHYVRKLKIYFEHYIEENRINNIKEIPDEISKEDVIKIHARENGRWIQWKRIAKCIEKNDFALTGCNYGLTKADKESMKNLKKKWGDLLGIDEYQTKPFIELKKEIENEKD